MAGGPEQDYKPLWEMCRASTSKPPSPRRFLKLTPITLLIDIIMATQSPQTTSKPFWRKPSNHSSRNKKKKPLPRWLKNVHECGTAAKIRTPPDSQERIRSGKKSWWTLGLSEPIFRPLRSCRMGGIPSCDKWGVFLIWKGPISFNWRISEVCVDIMGLENNNNNNKRQ